MTHVISYNDKAP